MTRSHAALLLAILMAVSASDAAFPGPPALPRGRDAAPPRAAAHRCDVTQMPGLWTLGAHLRTALKQAEIDVTVGRGGRRPSPGSPAAPASADGPGGPDARAQALAALTVGAWQDFQLVARAILGAKEGPESDADVRRVGDALLAALPAAVTCDAGARSRDQFAWRMSLAGYSAREMADVLLGRLLRGDIDRARAMLMAGASADTVAAALDAAMATRASARERANTDAHVRSEPPSNGRDRYLEPARRLAVQHGLDPKLVEAVIGAESGWRPDARSSQGAIGLMQLVPSTAAMLGVNPHDPLENLRGGITYLSGLVRAFGNVRDALIAYNAGPQHAERVRSGLSVLYAETRQYLATIASRYPI